ncbi:tetratricopeptide repeat-containing sulfotransferase family protein [Pseudomarimonas salicorniae]|uniref:Sulfotransferase n=1 Tax=Pseudomarimonas salicorniae TaxID=2933270 RepID=A0ABT0GE95_9GAMM|nr:sulfotransferase [Lysobacter sp. CAU 1642]MCK7592869.1 sulfotransferase [Lysobacter sp. CAU 1642]
MTSSETRRAALDAARAALAAREFQRCHATCISLLQQDPRCAEALFLLGVIAAEHDNFAKAVEVFDRVLATGPPQAEVHAQRARCLLPLQRHREALEAARAGLACGPRDALTFDTLGVALTRAGAQDEAVEPFREACRRAPEVSGYRYNLGSALQFVGDFSGAESAYRQALDLDPADHRAWSALSQVAAGGLGAVDQARLHQQMRRDGLDADAALHLHHALAAQREREGRPAEALALLEQGKAAKREALGYRFEADAAMFEAALRIDPARPAADACPSEEPIFIVGLPRTGTTLVERILSSHPEVFAAGELTHFAVAVKRCVATPGRHVLDADTLRSAALHPLSGVGQAFLDSTRPRTGRTPRFIDKMPLNVFYAGLIHRALPRARIICLRRHPLDSCLSNYRQLFATGFSYYNYAYDLADCGRYWLGFDALCRHWRATLGTAWLEVHYEDVVDELEAQARRLLEHCGLDWHPACLDFHRNAAPVATASSVQVRQPLYRSSVGRWKRYGALLDPLRRTLGRRLEDWEAERGCGG